jgi:uncharacterized membrane protein YbhN (UPF0104 family)
MVGELLLTSKHKKYVVMPTNISCDADPRGKGVLIVKRWFRYLLYASLLFLAVALYKANYLVLPRIHSPAALAGSIALLFLGLLCDPISWKAILDKSGHPAGFRECFAAVGLSVFAKYIPGKIWAIVGRAGYVTEKCSHSLGALTSVSVTWQFICLWLGLIFGACGLVLLGKILVWGWPILFLWLGLTTVIFSDAAQSLARRAYKKVLGKQITIPRLSIRSTLATMPWFVLMWLFLSGGFYLLVVSLSPTHVPLSVGLGFPITITLGVFAVFAPGGIGVREGAMIGYLVLAGLPTQEATAVSITARLWYLVGEVFMFAVGLAANAAVKKAKKTGRRL